MIPSTGTTAAAAAAVDDCLGRDQRMNASSATEPAFRSERSGTRGLLLCTPHKNQRTRASQGVKPVAAERLSRATARSESAAVQTDGGSRFWL